MSERNSLCPSCRLRSVQTTLSIEDQELVLRISCDMRSLWALASAMDFAVTAKQTKDWRDWRDMNIQVSRLIDQLKPTLHSAYLALDRLGEAQ